MSSTEKLRILPSPLACIVHPPVAPVDTKKNLLLPHVSGILSADGVRVMRPDASCTIAMVTRDCPTVVLYESTSRIVLVLHCGRNQICDEGGRGIIGAAFAEFAKQKVDAFSVRGWVLGGIAAGHFPNDRHPELIGWIRARFGNKAIPDPERSTIDLGSIIQWQCGRTRLKYDGLDTYSDPRLGSRRAEHDGVPNKQNPNYIVVSVTAKEGSRPR